MNKKSFFNRQSPAVYHYSQCCQCSERLCQRAKYHCSNGDDQCHCHYDHRTYVFRISFEKGPITERSKTAPPMGGAVFHMVRSLSGSAARKLQRWLRLHSGNPHRETWEFVRYSRSWRWCLQPDRRLPYLR